MDADDERLPAMVKLASAEGHEFFIEVDEDYIRDNFNLHGLREKVTYFNEAM